MQTVVFFLVLKKVKQKKIFAALTKVLKERKNTKE